MCLLGRSEGIFAGLSDGRFKSGLLHSSNGPPVEFRASGCLISSVSGQKESFCADAGTNLIFLSKLATARSLPEL